MNTLRTMMLTAVNTIPALAPLLVSSRVGVVVVAWVLQLSSLRQEAGAPLKTHREARDGIKTRTREASEVVTTHVRLTYRGVTKL